MVVQRYKYTNFPTTGYARALKFLFIRRELGRTGTACLFQFTYCDVANHGESMKTRVTKVGMVLLAVKASS